MIHEFAVEPAAIDNWKDFRFIFDQIGVEHGRLISRFPRKWEAMVMEAARDNQRTRDIERAKIAEKLRKSDNKTVRMCRPYDPEISWMKNVQAQQKQHPFRAVVGRQNDIAADNFLSIDELDDTQPLWNVSKDIVVSRKAWDLACCARLLLQISKEIIIIDPNFDPVKSRFLEPFSHLINFAFDHRIPERLELHAEYGFFKDQKRETDWKSDCCKNLSPMIPECSSIEIFQWEMKRSGDKPHARYILTELGGIRYDYGLDEGEGQTTDVSLLASEVYKRRWQDYQKETAAYHLHDQFTITGSKIVTKG